MQWEQSIHEHSYSDDSHTEYGYLADALPLPPCAVRGSYTMQTSYQWPETHCSEQNEHPQGGTVVGNSFSSNGELFRQQKVNE